MVNHVYKHFLATTNESIENTDDSDNKGGLKSVLVYVRNKSSKKSVSWKQESVLVQVSYFEHDETERGMIYMLTFLM